MAPQASQHTLLDELDERQDLVLAQLDELHERTERLLGQWLATIAVAAPASPVPGSAATPCALPGAPGATEVPTQRRMRKPAA